MHGVDGAAVEHVIAKVLRCHFNHSLLEQGVVPRVLAQYFPCCALPPCSKGATLGCFKLTCRASYHLACARKYRCLLQARGRCAPSELACCVCPFGSACYLCESALQWLALHMDPIGLPGRST